MIQLIKMAYRDLGRNRRRSLLSALALGIGLALLLLMASVIAGELRGSLDSSIKLQSGNLQVRAKTFDENKTSLAWTDLVENPDKIAGQIAGLPQVQVATPRLYASGIVTAGDNSLGVRIMGIDPPSAANAPIQAARGCTRSNQLLGSAWAICRNAPSSASAAWGTHFGTPENPPGHWLFGGR